MKYGIPVVCLLAVGYFTYRKMSKQKLIRKIPDLSDEDLMKVFDKGKNYYSFITAAEELKKREMEVGFLKLQFIEMILANNPGANRVGWKGLGQFFGEEIPEIDFSQA
ncbi:MAG: hypothetical protein AAF492_15835, partial [Verrucomicrobiota bacterium]